MISRLEPSDRSNVTAFHAMDVLRAATALEAQGRHVVHMEVGQPGSPAPERARAAAAKALDDPMGYTVALGRDDLRAGIARLYGEWYGVDLDPARVVVTSGSSGAFMLAFLALFDVGDRVAVADPSYPSYRNTLAALGLEAARIEGRRETGYQPTPADLAAAAPCKGLLVASPNNPTGTMLGRERLGELIAAAREAGVAFISDEIYHGLHYGERASSALEFSDEAIIINSFSKYFCMTGWRIGWMVVPPHLIRTIERLAQNLFICAPHVSQVAALAALQAQDELEIHHAAYAKNRSLLLQALPEMGLSDLAPCDGAFYVYADISHLTEDSLGWCARLLEEAGVAATPGLDFDPVRGGRFVRFSFAGAAADVEEGVSRLRRWLAAG